MKKNIFFGVAFIMIALNLAAQDQANVSAAVSKAFTETFPRGERIVWTPLKKGVTQAQFVNGGCPWIAYFDEHADIISSGRRIKSIDLLPLKIQSGLLSQKSKLEKKFGELTIFSVYELLTADATNYFATLQNTVAQFVVSVSTGGYSTVMSEQRLNTKAVVAPKDAIAKKD